MRCIVGVDIGGTFTDCVALKVPNDGSSPVVKIAKSSSTPPDFQIGSVGPPALVRRWHSSLKA